MSGFLDKAKEMAENVLDKIEDKLPDNVKEKLHIGDDKAQADEATAPSLKPRAQPKMRPPVSLLR